MKPFIYTLPLLLLTTCPHNTVSYTLTNNTGAEIDSVSFSHSYGDEKVIYLTPQDKIDGELHILKHDKEGVFGMLVYSKDKTKEYSFGSYRNAKAEASGYNITITKDSILWHEIK